MSGLRDLDDRLVPRLAARVRRAVDAVRGHRSDLGERARSVVAPVPTASRPGPLRRLDDRFAQRGPLGVVRDVPQVGLVVIAAVFFAGAGVALARGGEDGPGRASSNTVASPASRVLGPAVGASVPDYVAQAKAHAVELSRQRPGVLHVALVSLTAYGKPDDVRRLLAGLEVQRAYLRVPSDQPTEVLPAPVQDLAGDLKLLYTAKAGQKAKDQVEFLSLARSIVPENPEQRRFKEFYEQAARLSGLEATAYRTGCACLFAVVVRGRASDLTQLTAYPGIRAVELAPGGVPLEQLRVQPLDPADTTVVGGRSPAPRPTS
ncbi:MAG: hypothetical protein JWN17_2169 [Frankiales bacterium]|nr:hypothetical protein [Frankiales bacterium]